MRKVLAALAAQFDTPIATGEMLTSPGEHAELIRHRAADYLMPDAPRVGGITPFSGPRLVPSLSTRAATRSPSATAASTVHPQIRELGP